MAISETPAALSFGAGILTVVIAAILIALGPFHFLLAVLALLGLANVAVAFLVSKSIARPETWTTVTLAASSVLFVLGMAMLLNAPAAGIPVLATAALGILGGASLPVSENFEQTQAKSPPELATSDRTGALERIGTREQSLERTLWISGSLYAGMNTFLAGWFGVFGSGFQPARVAFQMSLIGLALSGTWAVTSTWMFLRWRRWAEKGLRSEEPLGLPRWLRLYEHAPIRRAAGWSTSYMLALFFVSYWLFVLGDTLRLFSVFPALPGMYPT